MKKDWKYKITIGILISIIIIILWIHGDITKLLMNTDDKFDNSILWSAIGAIASILGFLGVIYTIIKERKNIVEANIHDLEEKKLVRNQERFEDDCKKHFNILFDEEIIDTIVSMTNDNYSTVLSKIWEFKAKKGATIANLNWYYQGENLSIFPKYYRLMCEISSFNNESNKVLKDIETIALEYDNADIFITLERLMIQNVNLDGENKILWDELSSKYTNTKNMCLDIKSRIGDKLKQYNQIKNIFMDKIEYAFYEAINEKNEVINLRLNINNKSMNNAKCQKTNQPNSSEI